MCECATSTERFRVFLPSVECLTLYRFSMIAQDDISYKLVRGFECYILRRLPFFFFFSFYCASARACCYRQLTFSIEMKDLCRR